MEMELFSVELGPSSLQGLLYLFKDEADICRFAATMGLIPRGGSVLQGALGSAGDCQTGGPDLALFSAPALGSSWPPGSGFRGEFWWDMADWIEAGAPSALHSPSTGLANSPPALRNSLSSCRLLQHCWGACSKHPQLPTHLSGQSRQGAPAMTQQETYTTSPNDG